MWPILSHPVKTRWIKLYDDVDEKPYAGWHLRVSDLVSSPEVVRLERPPPDLIREAGRAYLRSRGLATDTALAWTVVGRVDGRGSTVLRMVMSIDGTGEVPLFLKQFHPPEGEGNAYWTDTFRSGIERTTRFSKQIAELGSPHGIGVAEPLAVDREGLFVVTLGVRGDPLGKALWRTLRVGRRQAKTTYRLIGQATALLEEVSIGQAPANDYLDVERLAGSLQKIQSHISPPESRRLEERIRSLHEEFSTAMPSSFYFCHGDFNHANLLVSKDGINVIDFGWKARPRAFDISMFLLRLEMERPRIEPLTTQVTEWLCEGYGDPDIQRSPSFTLVRFKKLSAAVPRLESRGKYRQARHAASLLRDLAQT